MITELRHRHELWYYATLGFALCAVFFLLGGLLDERTFNGVTVWHKPFKFALSLSVFFATLGWFAPLLEDQFFATTKGRLLTWVPLACAILELFYIALRASQSEASHFNESTRLNAIMYSLMGFGAILMVLSAGWMGVKVLRLHGTSDPWILAVGLGLIATLVLGGGFGMYLGNNGSHWVGGNPTDAGGLPLFNWSRNGGDLRVAHFFGMHAMQILPLFGALVLWLKKRQGFANRVASLLVVVTTIVFSAFTTSTFVQAVGGRPLL